MTRVVSAILLSSIVILALPACTAASSSDDPNEAVKAIMAVETKLRTALAEKDAAKLADLYASNASIFIPGEARPRVGTEAITKGAQKDFSDPAFHVTMTTGRVAGASTGDSGYSKGSFTVRYTDPKTKSAAGYSGYYLTLFAKQKDGSWKVTEDMATPAS